MSQHKGKAGHDTFISKTLSWILRHGARQENLPITSDGYIEVSVILNCKQLKGKCVIEDIFRIVENNNKKRFSLRTNHIGNLEIKANQGHSIEGICDLDLEPIIKPEQVENVIHGTYYKCWNSIKNNGLSRMNRLHIHFANGLPNDNVISGMRNNVEIAIYLDIIRALESNLKFYRSPNGVILSPGDVDGVIEPKFFSKVCDVRTGKLLHF